MIDNLNILTAIKVIELENNKNSQKSNLYTQVVLL